MSGRKFGRNVRETRPVRREKWGRDGTDDLDPDKEYSKGTDRPEEGGTPYGRGKDIPSPVVLRTRVT